ncbi:23S rRNA (pseudouridine(1915)-N(3))-methyltransferase RlmH [Mycoplasma elephantis]|uniref:23S rRNA (pseudouridine(1915)-N(3))-methyltransferase RlmH n=1 Tax=Mycoplasma elephantis TaxID=114882 RepID=UPI000485EE4F|nr:23S rRNA (pseudouridine(1915)-N(3))-methyltransferase RlmH [Mycoplasma elephantis]
MQINLVCFGKLSKNNKLLFDDYLNKIHGCKINVIELKELNIKNIDLKIRQETELAIDKIPKNSITYFLDLNGEKIDSLQFAKKLNNSNITFLIGSSNGFDKELIKDYCSISFSDLTFPHELFRIMLIEQIYRGIKINSNSNYHK